MAELIGKQLGQYVIVAEIGRGGMASVYKAHDATMGRDVAIKIMDDRIAHDPDFIARFDREVKLIARLEHPHILPVYSYGRVDDLTYLAMRLVDGEALDKRLRKGKLPLEHIVRIFDHIANALAYAHANGVVHRDLKPNNILLDSTGNAYLTDFGIAKMMKSETKLTASGMVMGTPSYMAPELWRGEPADARVDIYALGIMLYEMLTGEPPFSADTPYEMMYKHIDTPLPSPVAIRPDVPRGIADAVHTATAKVAAKRYASATDFAAAVHAGFTGQQRTVPDENTEEFGARAIPSEQPTPINPNQETNPQSLSGSVVVQKRKTPPKNPPWAILAGIGAAVVIVIVALAVLLRGQPLQVTVVTPGGTATTSAAAQTATTSAPTAVVAAVTTAAPTSVPTTVTQTNVPSAVPTTIPTVAPPTGVPTSPPTIAPSTAAPTTIPSTVPTDIPTAITATNVPPVAPTDIPTVATTGQPAPTIGPATPSVPSVRLEVYRDMDTLTLYMPDQDKVSLTTLAIQVTRPNGQTKSALLKDYPSFVGLPFDNVGGPICFQIGTRARSTPLPLECRQIPSTSVFIERLTPANLFWFDAVANAPLTVSIMLGAQSLGQCPANEPQCELFIPLNGS